MRRNIVLINPLLRTGNLNADNLMLKAREEARSGVVPIGVKFAQSEYVGRRYALEATLYIRVSHLDHAVSKTILRDGTLSGALKANRKRWKEEGRLKPILVRK